MPGRLFSLDRLRPGFLAGLLLFAAVMPACCLSLPAAADGLDNRSLQLFNDSPSVTTHYMLSFTIASPSTQGSMEILFCSNSPLEVDICDIPVGLNVTPAQISAVSGLSSVLLFPAATNEMVITWGPTTVTSPLPVSFTFSGIINPNAIGSYYVRVSTYNSSNITGPVVDFGGMAFAIASNLQVTSVVPPYLTFCSGLTISNFDCSSASGDYVDFGDLSAAHSSQADSQLLVATNAPDGYIIQVYGTTMTAGNNIISAMTGDAASKPGSSQFGINLRANTTPAVGADPAGPGTGEPAAAYDDPNHYQFVNDDTIVNSTAADFRKYTVSYIVNASSTQAPGVYASTLTYVCAGSF